MDNIPTTKEGRRRYLRQLLNEAGLSKKIDQYLELFPELDSRLCKFGSGIILWNKTGQISLDNPDDVSRVRLILKVIDQTPAYDFFDNTFNEADPDTVCEILGMSSGIPAVDTNLEFDYTVAEIRSYRQAFEYFEDVAWCIVISEESFKEYTANGNRFYFCANKDWRDTPSTPGPGFPRDRYGYSLIAVEVTPDDRIASITSRWNTCSEDTADFISEEALKSILGEENYTKLFV